MNWHPNPRRRISTHCRFTRWKSSEAPGALGSRTEFAYYRHYLCLNHYRKAILSVKFFPTSRTAIDGHWGRWSDWSSCSVTCGDGYRKRYRKCDNPAPVQGGLNCPGSSTEADGCVMRRCTLGKYYRLCLIHAEISLCSYTFINVVVLPIVTSFFTLLTLLSWTHYFSRSCFIFMSIEMKRLNVHLRTRFF